MIRTYTRKLDVSWELADKVNVEKLCRFCLSKEDELLPIFDSKVSAPGLLAIRIKACLSLEVSENDELPKNICLLCHYHLEKYDDFRKSCESAEQKIRRHLYQVKQGNDQTPASGETTIGLVQTEKGNVGRENQDVRESTRPDTTNLEVETVTATKTSISTKDLDVIEPKQQAVQECGARVVTALQSALVAGGVAFMRSGVLSMPTLPAAQYPLTMHVLQSDGSTLVMDVMPEDNDEPSRENTLTAVKKSATKTVAPVYRCQQCGQRFARRLLLQRHLSVHSQNRGISCALCQKWFPSRSSLLRHERTHTGERPFACPECPRRFGQKEILQRHRHVHLKERPFVCEVCGRGFTQRSALLLHRRSHAPPSSRAIQLHHCIVCPKVFCYASGLSRHILTHMGRTYSCSECDKTFNDKSSSKRHERVAGHRPA